MRRVAQKQKIGRESLFLQLTICFKSYPTASQPTPRSVIQNFKQKTDDQTAPYLLFFMEDGRLDAERGVTRTHNFSLCLISEQQVEAQEQQETHHRLHYESLCGPLLTVT